jgi:xylono-1,5-lactonase
MTNVRVIDRNVRDTLGEGLFWSERENALYWTDILAPALNRLDLATGQVRRWTMPEMIGWVIEREQGGLIAGFQSGFAELSLDPVTVQPIADPEPDQPANRMNDAKADPWGNIWSGTMPVAIDRPSGGLYRLSADRKVQRFDTGYTVANGPAISPDGRWLYHTDTPARIIYRFALSRSGVHDRTVFLRFEESWGVPDGMTCDAEGGLWVAHWGGARVSRFTPDARLDRAIELPALQITNVCFAGEGLDRMFVTSAADGREDEPLAGALFEVDPGCRGLPPYRFAG